MKLRTQFILLLLFVGILTQVQGQVVNAAAKGKISIGVGMFTDVMM